MGVESSPPQLTIPAAANNTVSTRAVWRLAFMGTLEKKTIRVSIGAPSQEPQSPISANVNQFGGGYSQRPLLQGTPLQQSPVVLQVWP